MKLVDDFNTFWPKYIVEHQDKNNRRMHFVASLLGLSLAIVFLLTMKISIALLALVLSYGFAWAGHFIFEKNKPLTWKNPLLSLMADYRLFFVMIVGDFNEELNKFKVVETVEEKEEELVEV